MGFHVSFKKPLGGGNSFIRNTVKNPTATLTGAVLGPGNALAGSLLGNGVLSAKHAYENSGINNPTDGTSEQDMIERKYGKLASDFQDASTGVRDRLARSLTESGGQLFQQENPYILEDLNSRGLFTSQSAVNKSQADALGEIAGQNRNILNDFDTDVFNQTQQLKATGVSSGLQRSFDVADQARQNAMIQSLAAKQRRNQMISSILGLGGQLGSAAILA